ncbi:MAG TPA: glycoside hydrolase [Clostridiaceae bacterium]|nr:glycoside hydrolase [Clostridiaceae bacterium]
MRLCSPRGIDRVHILYLKNIFTAIEMEIGYMKKKYIYVQITLLFVIFLSPLCIISSKKDLWNHNNYKSNNAYSGNKKNESIYPSNDLQDSISKEPANSSNNISDSELNEKAKSGWNLAWNDEFNSNAVDDKYWTLQNGGDLWGNNELQYYTDREENCYIKDGKLIIRGLKEDYRNHQYTSARIVTKEKLEFLYGKIEVKAKFPEGNGLFPAIWLLPCENNYGDGKKNGEIDLVEILGNDPEVIYGVAHYSLKNQNRSYKRYSDGITNFSMGFHVYSIEWSPQEIKWMVDDKAYFSLNLMRTFDKTYNPFNKKMYLIMNLAIGGNWPGNNLGKTTFPSYVEIDYVRYYK